MKNSIVWAAGIAVMMSWLSQTSTANENRLNAFTPSNSLDFKVKDISGKEVALTNYLGKVVVIVNVASKCGFTPQYESLQSLYDQHQDDGLVILGFPCNQFGGQEPGSETEIKAFCQENYGVEFDMFSKLDVKGKGQSPLYKYYAT